MQEDLCWIHYHAGGWFYELHRNPGFAKPEVNYAEHLDAIEEAAGRIATAIQKSQGPVASKGTKEKYGQFHTHSGSGGNK